MPRPLKSATRRASREFALQALYGWLLTGVTAAEALKTVGELDDFDKADHEFLKAQVRGTIGEAEGLRAQLEPLADRKWDEVSPVERAILLLAAWEMMHNPEIPYRVTINEAIELGKRFGGTDGHKWVNGVLDKLASQVRPDEVAQKRQTRHGK
jgi:N utilization substance protein B